jgi:hypothetical protein
MVRSFGVLAVLLALVQPCPADIFEWRDAEGVRRFTNDRGSIPTDAQPEARLLVREPEGGAPSVVEVQSPPPEVRAPQAQVSRPGREEAYERGLRDGLEMAEDARGPQATVEINAPLVTAASNSSGFGAPWVLPVDPLVTTSFDRGRSRHMTLRMLLQDQFQMDRDGPFAYRRLDAPGLGPALSPFLSRGIAGSVQRGRVVYR